MDDILLSLFNLLHITKQKLGRGVPTYFLIQKLENHRNPKVYVQNSSIDLSQAILQQFPHIALRYSKFYRGSSLKCRSKQGSRVGSVVRLLVAQGLIPSIHTDSTQSSLTPIPGDQCLLISMGIHMVHIHASKTYRDIK